MKRFGASLRASCGTGLTSVRRIHSSSLTYQEGGSEGGRTGENEGEREGTRKGGNEWKDKSMYGTTILILLIS